MARTLDIKVFGDTLVSRDIVRVGARARDLNPAFRSVFRRLDEISAEQFFSHGSRGGVTWEPLKEATIIQKIREGSKTPEEPERRTDALFEAMTSPSSPDREELFGGEWAVFRIAGEPGDYGAIQHRGAPSINLPARRLYALTEIDRQEFVREIQYYLRTGRVRYFL